MSCVTGFGLRSHLFLIGTINIAKIAWSTDSVLHYEMYGGLEKMQLLVSVDQSYIIQGGRYMKKDAGTGFNNGNRRRDVYG
jgi:hypothetical protein